MQILLLCEVHIFLYLKCLYKMFFLITIVFLINCEYFVIILVNYNLIQFEHQLD